MYVFWPIHCDVFIKPWAGFEQEVSVCKRGRKEKGGRGFENLEKREEKKMRKR